MDLSKLDTASGSEEGRWLEPFGNDGKKIGLRIKVLGPDSRRYAMLKAEVNREGLNALSDVMNGLTPKDQALTDTEKEARFYAKMTIGWESTTDEPVTWDGKPFEYSEENAILFYTKAAVVKRQVQSFVEGRKNFIKPESVA